MLVASQIERIWQIELSFWKKNRFFAQADKSSFILSKILRVSPFRPRLIDTIEENDRKALIQIIDALLTKQRMRELLKEAIGVEQ